MRTCYYFFSFKPFNFISLWISFHHRINNKFFSWPIFGITFAKDIFVLRNIDSIINFKFRNFRICFSIFSQNRIIMHTTNQLITNNRPRTQRSSTTDTREGLYFYRKDWYYCSYCFNDIISSLFMYICKHNLNNRNAGEYT